MIKVYLVLLSILSCTHEKIHANQDEWGVINKIELERWNKEKIIGFLGVPDDIHDDEKQKINFLIYNYPQSNHQKWSFEISKNGELRNITFLPNSSNRNDFSSEKLSSVWGGCVEKSIRSIRIKLEK